MGRIGSFLSPLELASRHQLLRANNRIETASTRLSTLRRINTGADDPAGLIAAESIRAELTALAASARNADRAASAVNVADSDLGRVTDLFNTIRDRVLQSADGTTSDAQRAANQLEIDAALEAIDRIGRFTQFNGRRLLDGTSGFQVSGVNDAQVADITVHARGGGTTTEIDIDVVQSAAPGELVADVSGGALAEDTTLVVSGNQGSEALQLAAGTSLDDVAAAINAVSSTTGVEASASGDQLMLASTGVGSAARVAVDVQAGALSFAADTAVGTDAVAIVNGVEVSGTGNELRVSNDFLQADISLAEGFAGQADTITVSGEALRFAFNPNPGETTTLALGAVAANALGGAAGRLSDLRTGGSASLASGNPARSISILDAARNQVLADRGRAGAFVKTTIDSAREVIAASEINLTAALSSIEDADVAVEQARLVQGQILARAARASFSIAGRGRAATASLLDLTARSSRGFGNRFGR